MNLPRSNLSSAPMALVCASGCTTVGVVAAASRTAEAAGAAGAGGVCTVGAIAIAPTLTSAMPAVANFLPKTVMSNFPIPRRSGTRYGPRRERDFSPGEGA